MSKGKIKAGDVVRLKSGGDKMTVVSVNSKSAKVAWFPFQGCDRNEQAIYGILQFASFGLATLDQVYITNFGAK